MPLDLPRITIIPIKYAIKIIFGHLYNLQGSLSGNNERSCL